MENSTWITKHKKKVYIAIGGVLLIALGAAVGLKGGMFANKTAGGINKGQQTTVEALVLTRQDVTKRVVLSGQTVPEAQVDIAAKYQGRVSAVNVVLGQQVAAGDVLVVQDIGDADIAIRQNQAAYRQASADAVAATVSFQANYEKVKGDYERAAANYQRYTTLFGVGAISKEQLDTSAQQLAAAKAALDMLANQINTDSVPAAIESSQAAAAKAQQTVAASEKQRNDLVLRAPRAGIIGYRQVEPGAIVAAGQKLLSVVDNSRMYVDCQVAEQDLPIVALGMPVNVVLDSLGKTLSGTIIYISPAIDTQTQAFSLRIDLAQPGAEVKSGMFARSTLTATVKPQVLAVPNDAVVDKNGKSYVFVIGSQNVLEERVVQLGIRGDQQVEVLSGVQEGEQIAVSNLARLRGGMSVLVQTAAAGGEAGK